MGLCCGGGGDGGRVIVVSPLLPSTAGAFRCPAGCHARAGFRRPVFVVAPSWHSPVDGSGPGSSDRSRRRPAWLPGHRGVDLAGAAGDPVLLLGRACALRPLAGRGVSASYHPAGLRTTYEP